MVAIALLGALVGTSGGVVVGVSERGAFGGPLDVALAVSKSDETVVGVGWSSSKSTLMYPIFSGSSGSVALPSSSFVLVPPRSSPMMLKIVEPSWMP